MADRRQIETLATCHCLREKTNLLFLGPTGVGKSRCEIPMVPVYVIDRVKFPR